MEAMMETMSRSMLKRKSQSKAFRCDHAGSCGAPAEIFMAGVIPAETIIVRDVVARCSEHAPLWVAMVRGAKVPSGPAWAERWDGWAWVPA